MKKITSLTLGISFLIMTYTGVMLFLAPHGRVAYWSNWKLLGLGKDEYGNLHTTSMIVFVLFGLLHIYYNWKAIVSYLKNKQRELSFTKKEFLIALGINIFFVVGTIYMIQPFKGFLDFEENFKDSWTRTYGEPPYGHAELTKLNIFCKKMNIDFESAKKKLQKNSITFNQNDTLLEISKKNHTTPEKIYNIIKDKASTKENIPSGLGRKTLKQLTDLGFINLEKSLDYLKAKNVSNINKDETMKNIADELEITPLELFEKLKKIK